MSEVMEMETEDNLAELSDEELNAQLHDDGDSDPHESAETEVVNVEAPDSDDTELDPVQKELTELKKVLGRQGQELGELRKLRDERESQELAEPELTPDQAMDELVRNPTEFVRKQQAAAELERRQGAERQRVAYDSNLEVIKGVHSDFDDIKQDVVDYAKSRGENASLDMVEQLVATNPGYLNLYIDKMKMEKEVSDLRSIVTGNKRRTTRSAVASKRSVVKGPAGSQKVVTDDVTDFTSLNDSELEAILKG